MIPAGEARNIDNVISASNFTNTRHPAPYRSTDTSANRSNAYFCLTGRNAALLLACAIQSRTFIRCHTTSDRKNKTKLYRIPRWSFCRFTILSKIPSTKNASTEMAAPNNRINPASAVLFHNFNIHQIISKKTKPITSWTSRKMRSYQFKPYPSISQTYPPIIASIKKQNSVKHALNANADFPCPNIWNLWFKRAYCCWNVSSKRADLIPCRSKPTAIW